MVPRKVTGLRNGSSWNIFSYGQGRKNFGTCALLFGTCMLEIYIWIIFSLYPKWYRIKSMVCDPQTRKVPIIYFPWTDALDNRLIHEVPSVINQPLPFPKFIFFWTIPPDFVSPCVSECVPQDCGNLQRWRERLRHFHLLSRRMCTKGHGSWEFVLTVEWNAENKFSSLSLSSLCVCKV